MREIVVICFSFWPIKTDCRVLPFLADDLPVEEAGVQVKRDFISPAGCSKCSQASHEELSQTLNMSACGTCSGVDPRLPPYLTALSACLCCFWHDRISAVSCSLCLLESCCDPLLYTLFLSAGTFTSVSPLSSHILSGHYCWGEQEWAAPERRGSR